MTGDGSGQERPRSLSDAALWRRSRTADAVADDIDGFLDLAAFADGRLDAEERERIAERLDCDPDAAADVAAARALAGASGRLEPAADPVVARACALVGGGATQPDGPDNVVLFPPRPVRTRPRLYGVAGWGSLAAAVAVASWLGFTLGVDTSRSFAPAGRAGGETVLHELLDPSTAFMADLGEGAQT